VLIEETVTCLEMTSPDQLVPGRAPPAPIHLLEAGAGSASLVRSAYERIAEPHGWLGRAAWSDEEWKELLLRPEIRVWVALFEEAVAGMVELECQARNEVGINVFGLVPELVGKGYGGHLLTVATRLAWRIQAPTGDATTRVWLQTSSRDHPHALPNYERRGFRIFHTERRQREVLP
jgi:GNAT superfamily N-acetyltransferase